MSHERVADQKDITGEGPLWHPDEEVLYWVDIPDGELRRYDPSTEETELMYTGDRIGGFTIQENGDLLLFMDQGAVKTWNDGISETVIESIPEEHTSRFNDVVAGPNGRVYCGTMPEGSSPGRLYRLDRDGRLTLLIEGVAIPNGMGFTPDHDRLYFAETEQETIWSFDYDSATGNLRKKQRFARTVGGPGTPDGLTVDEDGYVWSARWNGGCVVRHAPDGRVVEQVPFPARKVSAVTFGGPNYEDAYVTTAIGEGTRAVEGKGAGVLYKADLGVRGIPEFRSAIDTHRVTGP